MDALQRLLCPRNQFRQSAPGSNGNFNGVDSKGNIISVENDVGPYNLNRLNISFNPFGYAFGSVIWGITDRSSPKVNFTASAARFRLPHEQTIRLFVFCLGIFVTPVLLGISYRSWRTHYHDHLKAFRNGLSLTSLVFVLLAWFQVAAKCLTFLTNVHITLLTDPAIMSIILYLILAATLLGFALRGAPRIYTVVASLLMWASLQAIMQP